MTISYIVYNESNKSAHIRGATLKVACQQTDRASHLNINVGPINHFMGDIECGSVANNIYVRPVCVFIRSRLTLQTTGRMESAASPATSHVISLRVL